MFHRNMTRY